MANLTLHVIVHVALFIECVCVNVDPTLSRYLLPGVSSHNLSLSVQLSGNGYHRVLSTTTSGSIGNVSLPKYSPMRSLLRITKDVYVDVDQLRALEELGTPQMSVSAHMDTEQPATHSSDHWLLINGLLDTPLSVPLHLRYQSPSAQLYTTVSLHYPHLYVQCANTEATNTKPSCGSVQPVTMSCAEDTSKWCLWISVSTEPGALQMNVPCGLTSHTIVVTPITIAVALGGAAYLIKIIKRVHTNREI